VVGHRDAHPAELQVGLQAEHQDARQAELQDGRRDVHQVELPVGHQDELQDVHQAEHRLAWLRDLRLRRKLVGASFSFLFQSGDTTSDVAIYP
jgi:hypothetical protein